MQKTIPTTTGPSLPIERVPAPAYVLEMAKLRRNLELIQSVQERAGVSVILALKAFAGWRVFPFIGEYLRGATASSPHEARLIYDEMGLKAHTYAPAFLPEDFDEVLSLSSHLTFNSLSEYHRYALRVAQHPEPVSVGLRVNPEQSDVEHPLYNPASPHSRLGVLQEELRDGLPEGIEGLHLHVLCESGADALEAVIQAFEQGFGHLFPRLKWVNLGGGHLMTRVGYDLERLVRLLRDFRERTGLEVWLEPGSAVLWDTGPLVARVLDIVERRGVKTAMVDVSFTAHMPDTLEMPYRPRIYGASDPVEGKPTYRIGGVSCLSGDFMEAYSYERELSVGDRIVFEDMIHYTMVKTTTFNGVKHPGICIWHEDGTLEVVREFTYSDYKSRLS